MMALDEQKVIDYLSENYAGSTAARALWMWAGGRREDIEYTAASQEQWGLLWAEAKKLQGAAPISLVREALFDHPHEEALFGFLDALAEQGLPEWRETAGVFLSQLKNLAPEFDPQALWAASQSMPALTADSHLAVIASTLRDLFSGEHRRVLKERFQVLKQGAQPPPPPVVADGMQRIVLRAIPEFVVFEDASRFGEVAEKIKALLNAATDASRETLMPVIEKMPEYMERLRNLPAKSGDKGLEAAVSGIERQRACLEKMANQEDPPAIENILQACVHLIWCTRGEAPEEGEEQAPAQEEAHAEGSEGTNNE
jgi:hypothetical protein